MLTDVRCSDMLLLIVALLLLLVAIGAAAAGSCGAAAAHNGCCCCCSQRLLLLLPSTVAVAAALNGCCCCCPSRLLLLLSFTVAAAWSEQTVASLCGCCCVANHSTNVGEAGDGANHSSGQCREASPVPVLWASCCTPFGPTARPCGAACHKINVLAGAQPTGSCEACCSAGL